MSSTLDGVRVEIPGFAVHQLEYDDEACCWAIRNKRTGRVLPGAVRPGRARRFNLRGENGRYANRTLDGWLHYSGVGTPMVDSIVPTVHV